MLVVELLATDKHGPAVFNTYSYPASAGGRGGGGGGGLVGARLARGGELAVELAVRQLSGVARTKQNTK